MTNVESKTEVLNFTPPKLKPEPLKDTAKGLKIKEKGGVLKRKVLVLEPLGEALLKARNEPPQRKIIGDLISEGEQIILFGDSNTGKSLLAMQIAIAVAKGEDLAFKNADNQITLKNECEAQRVLYMDFEHSNQQLEKRIDFDQLDQKSKENIFIGKVEVGEMLEGHKPGETFKEIKEAAEECKSKFIIIDNISAISGDLEKGENAKQFLSPLWRLCRQEKYTVIILAHSPKQSAQRYPLTLNDIAGSKKLPALVDSVIGIAAQESNQEGLVYIKQLKARTGEKKYGINNVLCSKITKVNGLVQHLITHTANEYEVIGKGNDGEAKAAMLEKSAIAYLESGNLREAAEKIGVSKDTVGRHVKELKKLDPQLFEMLSKTNPQELKDYKEGAELLASQKTNYPIK
jgi:archaellum biogenesis ATPase FlaH